MLIKSKTDEQKRDEARILHDFRIDAQSADKTQKECAEIIAAKTNELLKNPQGGFRN